MFYTILSLIFIVFVILLSVWTVKLLLKGPWLLGWLRGMAGLSLLFIAIVLLLTALDLFSYRQLLANKTIADISFIQRDNQHYDAVLVYDGRRQVFELHGDQWRVNARIFQWPSQWRHWGIRSGYRLDRISGRYLTLNDKNTRKHTEYALSDSLTSVDVWLWLKRTGGWISILDAHEGGATFLPMVDGGKYEIVLSASGVLSRPLNKPAKLAVDRWR